jgi:predicted DNA-binding protein with PD1-like motif
MIAMSFIPNLIYPVKGEKGSEIPDILAKAIQERGLRGGIIIAIGGLRRAEIGVYDREKGTYSVESFEAENGETLEVAPLIGNYMITSKGSLSIHLHINVSSRSSRASGHLVKGIVDPFLEAFLIEAGDVVKEAFTHRDI